MDYNMNIKCDQKCMFHKDSSTDFSIWLCMGYAWYAHPILLGISIYRPPHFEISFVHPEFFGISTLPPGTMGFLIPPPTGQKKVVFQRFNLYRKPKFRCRCDKKIKFNVYTILNRLKCHSYFKLKSPLLLRIVCT